MEAAPLSQSKAPSADCSRKWFITSAALAVLAGAALRVWMFAHFFEISGDSLIYGDIAKNLLLHRQFALTVESGHLHSTLIRLPGYPFFLAACFRMFGIENYAAVVWVQIIFDLGSCVLLADFARRVAPPSVRFPVAHCTLWLAALCPFTAVYAVTPLTEALTLFAISFALWTAACFRDRPKWLPALGFTFAVTSASLLRPDGALVALALAPALLVSMRRGSIANRLAPPLQHTLRMTVLCTLLALAPFASWTWRNWRVFHVFQPLAPRYATDPGEDPHAGWIRWVRTWCLDFVSTYNVYWAVPGQPIELSDIPVRAFDDPAQYIETTHLIDNYNRNGHSLTPQIEAGFARLAQQRIDADPLRFYVWLPLGRVADMWFRPRVENLPIDLDWWVYAHHHAETRFSWGCVCLNALYVLLGLAGLCMRPRLWIWMVAYLLLRNALLLTVEAPEARYTLEFFPILFACGGIALYRFTNWVSLLVLRVNAFRGSD